MDLRDLLIKNVATMYPSQAFDVDFRMLVDSIKPGFWMEAIPIGATPKTVINIVIERAMMEGWVRPIFHAINRNSANAAELAVIQASFDSQVLPTTVDPFREVLLDGNRPFANRQDLRFALREVCEPAGPPVLMIYGDPETGRSFSFYLAQHIARQYRFVTSQFEVKTLAKPDHLAGEILRRIGVPAEPEPKGVESGERWAEKLAHQVKTALEERQQKRLFVFDSFPHDSPLPPETSSFIVRLARYADEELRPWLRIVTIQFPTEFPQTIRDVAERDEVRPFTGADMLAVLQQVIVARGWSVSEQALLDEIRQVEDKPLRDRFLLMKRMLRALARRAGG